MGRAQGLGFPILSLCELVGGCPVCIPAHPKNQTWDLTTGKGRGCPARCGNHPGASWRCAWAWCGCSVDLPCQERAPLLFYPPFLVPAAAVPACFALNACNELLLAPGWLFANVNLPQTLLLVTQSHQIPLGAVAHGGKVWGSHQAPFPSTRCARSGGG